MFGTDDVLGEGMYQRWWRLLESDDDYIKGPAGWSLYALALPDATLRALYRGTALRVLNWQ